MSADPNRGTQALGATVAPIDLDSSPTTLRNKIATALDRAVFTCLCLIAIFAPHKVDWAFFAFQGALLLWFIRLISGRRFEPQPFLVPAVLFLSLASIATALSYAPLLSWARLEWFTLVLLAMVVSQTLTSVKHVRVLILLLLTSATGSVLRTG